MPATSFNTKLLAKSEEIVKDLYLGPEEVVVKGSFIFNDIGGSKWVVVQPKKKKRKKLDNVQDVKTSGDIHTMLPI